MGESMDYLEKRHKEVVKANALIQQSRFSLSVAQQKIILYLISQINPYDDNDFRLLSFDIRDFCRITGITELDSGATYSYLKQTIKEIADKSIWIKLPNGKDTLLRWIEKPYIEEKSGTIEIRLDNDMKPYLLQLKDNFTKYNLIFTLRMRSKYSIRMFELVSSILYANHDSYTAYYTFEQLRKLLDAEKYKTTQHLKDRVIEPSIREINEYSDKKIECTYRKEGKRIVGVELRVSRKDTLEVVKIESDIDHLLGIDENQLTLWEQIEQADKQRGGIV